MRNLHKIPTYAKYKHIVKPIHKLHTTTYVFNLNFHNALYRIMGPILFEYNLTGMYIAISSYKNAYHDLNHICI